MVPPRTSRDTVVDIGLALLMVAPIAVASILLHHAGAPPWVRVAVRLLLTAGCFATIGAWQGRRRAVRATRR